MCIMLKNCIRDECTMDNTSEAFIIATDWNRNEYIITYFTHKGLTYNIDEAVSFNTFDEVTFEFKFLLGGGRKVREYFGDLSGRELSIIKVAKSINTNRIDWNKPKTVVKSIFI